MSASNPAPLESATAPTRVEWVPETSFGEPPDNPSWNRFSDYIKPGPDWGGDPNTEGDRAQGSPDFYDHYRGQETHPLSFTYPLQRFPVDASGNIQGPEAVPIVNDGSSYYPSHTVVYRQEVTTGGNFGAGFRSYVVALGARVDEVTFPGDASANLPIEIDLSYEASYGRTHLIHQPDSATTLTLSSTDAQDTFDVVIENEGAGTTETVTLNGTTDVTTTTSFSDIDAIWCEGEPVGDISVTDGSGTDILEDPFVGTDGDGRGGYERGVPPLGTGSHASAIGTDPRNYHFLGTDQTWGGSNPAISAGNAGGVETADLTVSIDMGSEPRTGSPFPAIVPNTRTVTVELTNRGKFESYAVMKRKLDGYSADFVYEFPGDGSGGTPATITAKNAQVTDSDSYNRDPSEGTVSMGLTLEAHGSPSVTINKP
jgi:hypothetical protein